MDWDQTGSRFDVFSSTNNGSSSQADTNIKSIGHIVNDIAIPTVFGIGIIGNITSIGVFGHHVRNSSAGVLEKSTMAGLITLALSDLMFCMVGFPTIILGNLSHINQDHVISVISFYYDLYKAPLLNVFLFSSTWLITLISAERCMAVCFPHVARKYTTVQKTVLLHSSVFFISLCFNLPLFFAYSIHHYPCSNVTQCYVKLPAKFFYEQTNVGVHFVMWTILGTFLPLVLLLICNIGILKKVFNRQRTRSNTTCKVARLTWILVTMVFWFILCVWPSIILQFLFRIGVTTNLQHFSIANMATNLLQAIKFSSNFLLYCTLHRRFRKTIKGSFTSRTSRQRDSSRTVLDNPVEV